MKNSRIQKSMWYFEEMLLGKFGLPIMIYIHPYTHSHTHIYIYLHVLSHVNANAQGSIYRNWGLGHIINRGYLFFISKRKKRRISVPRYLHANNKITFSRKKYDFKFKNK